MPAMHRIPPLLNFGLYQLAWFACVMGAGAGHFLAGVIAVLAVCGLHLAASPHPGREFGIILATGFIGAAGETLLVKGGWVRYHGNGLEQFPPVWIVALWLAFATTFNASLRWLQGRYLPGCRAGSAWRAAGLVRGRAPAGAGAAGSQVARHHRAGLGPADAAAAAHGRTPGQRRKSSGESSCLTGIWPARACC